MAVISDIELIRKAKRTAKLHKSPDVTIGQIGCALVSCKNNIYIGTSINAHSSIGFCAEHSAIASMASNGEYQIKKIVAVSDGGHVIPPCGRCRELMYQINRKNSNTDVILDDGKTVKLKELLPLPWQSHYPWQKKKY